MYCKHVQILCKGVDTFYIYFYFEMASDVAAVPTPQRISWGKTWTWISKHGSYDLLPPQWQTWYRYTWLCLFAWANYTNPHLLFCVRGEQTYYLIIFVLDRSDYVCCFMNKNIAIIAILTNFKGQTMSLCSWILVTWIGYVSVTSEILSCFW